MAITGNGLNIAAPEKRHSIADYLKTGDTYHLMGTGFTTMNENYGAQEDGKVYVNDKEQSSTVTSYQREFPYNFDLIKSQAAVMALREVGERGLTGTDAMFEYVRVDLFLPQATGNDNTKYYARHFIVSAIPENEEGEGAATITGSGTLKPFGSMTEGWFDVTEKSFTEAATAYASVDSATPAAAETTPPAQTTPAG